MRRRLINYLSLGIILLIAAGGVYFYEDLAELNPDECLVQFLLPEPLETAINLAESHGLSEADISDFGWGVSEGQVFILATYTNGQQDGHPVCMSGDPNDPLPVIIHDGE
jgi:hypothetical protein